MSLCCEKVLKGRPLHRFIVVIFTFSDPLGMRDSQLS